MMKLCGYFVMNWLLLGISPIATVVFFSAVGKGAATYVFLQSWRDLGYLFGLLGAGLFLVLYLFDLCLGPQQDGSGDVLPWLFPSIIGRVLAFLMTISLMLAWLFTVGTFPSAPLLLVNMLLLAFVLFLVVTSGTGPFSRGAAASPSAQPSAALSPPPQPLAKTRSRLEQEGINSKRRDNFNIAQVLALLFHCIWTLFLWLFWVSDAFAIGGGTNNWDENTRSRLEQEGINSERFGTSVRNVMLYLWMAPAISSMGLFTVAVVVMFVGSMQRRLRRPRRPRRRERAPEAGQDEAASDGCANSEALDDEVIGALTENERDKIGTIVFMIKLLTGCLVVVCGCLWITASIVGSSLSLASTVQAFTLVFGGFLVVYIYMAFSGEARELLKKGARTSPLMKSAHQIANGDWAKATLFGMIFLALPFYLFMSFLNQLVRRCRKRLRSSDRVGPVDDECSVSTGTVTPEHEQVGKAMPFCMPKAPRRGWLTERVEKQMRQLGTWPWTAVHTKLQILCILAVSLQVVGGMGTNIFLAWVNSQLKGAGFLTLSSIFMLVGITMFMIPIVPGIAVYLFGGILIPAGYVEHAGTPGDYSHSSFWEGFLIACGLNFLLKMVAVTLQQKGIGEPMSTNLRVMQMVGANTPEMKAIERMLRRPGLNFPKITILCGGPDWPTSVLTGILRLSLPQMLLGTVPVITNVIFVTSAGTFRLRKAENETWSALSSVALTVASVWTVLQMALATYYIQETWGRYHSELSKPRLEHIELDWMDYVAEKQQEVRDKLTKWGVLPLLAKVCIFTGSTLMLTSSFFMCMLQSQCWDNFEVTDDIASLGLHFIRNEGWAAITVFAFSCCMHVVVQWWAGCRCRQECREVAEKCETDEKEQWMADQRIKCEDAQPGTQSTLDMEEEVTRLNRELQLTNRELQQTKREMSELTAIVRNSYNVLPACTTIPLHSVSDVHPSRAPTAASLLQSQQSHTWPGAGENPDCFDPPGMPTSDLNLQTLQEMPQDPALQASFAHTVYSEKA